MGENALVSMFVNQELKREGLREIDSADKFEGLVTHLVVELKGHIWCHQRNKFLGLDPKRYWDLRRQVREKLDLFKENYFHSETDPEKRSPMPYWIAHHLAYAIA